MKHTLIAIAVILLLIGGGFAIHVGGTVKRLQDKGGQVEEGVRLWLRQGRNPSEAIELAAQVKPALAAGEAKQAETLLDNALAILSEPAPARPVLPQSKTSDLYGNAHEVMIDGYDGQAMEPAISPDGETLFFNNENAAGDATDIYYAQRSGENSFKLGGKLEGVNVDKLDAVPSIDRNNRFYFTSLRSYADDMKSLYTGEFRKDKVVDLRVLPGDIWPKTAGEIAMDACINFDGRTLYLSRARFENGATVPKESDLSDAVFEGERWRIDAGSFSTFINVNSDALEYAPAISSDGLELYFTRAIEGGEPKLMVARRENADKPFSAPQTLSSIDGFVEAPSVPLDGREMFFHRRVDGKFRLFRATRKP